MKTKLSFLFLFLCSFFLRAQHISASVFTNAHYTQPYTVTFSGTGTLYYTIDGTEPTLSSNSAINNFTVDINVNKVIKVFLVTASSGTSETKTFKYFTGTIPLAKMFFKPPVNWPNSCVSIDMVEPISINGMIIDGNWNMVATGCEGWLQREFPYYKANLSFNNCPIAPPGAIYTALIPADSLILYDFTNGVITNAPACLGLGTSDLNKVVIVKLFPNPTDDFLEINSKISFKTYEIYTVDGRKITENNFFGSRIDVSKLDAGNYFLKLSSPKEEMVIIKFIKK